MKRNNPFSLTLVVLFLTFGLHSVAQTYSHKPYKRAVSPTKNVILMISDGTSMGVISAARWYKKYNKTGDNLAIDPYFCGTVQTFSSNAPIGDSAPTTSCYLTGMPQQTGNIAIYPPADPQNDLVLVDANMAYQPLATLLEAAKREQQKSVGMVVTCDFAHATPSDCAAHYHSRSARPILASQLAHQNLDVMFGSGTAFVSSAMKEHFSKKNITYIEDDLSAFRNLSEGKAWALFGKYDIPFDIDRDTTMYPSLREMTQKSLQLLSQNENGFFLMIEGSKVDWGAHSNDAVACITEFIAFDEAVHEVMEFAKRDGNTTVVILSDHGNSGFTTGRADLKNYDKASIEKLFGPVSKYQRTAKGLETILLKSSPDELNTIIKQYTDIDITPEEKESLLASKNYQPKDYTTVTGSLSMYATLVKILNKRTYFGFTTGGHTAEDVFLAAYHPKGQLPIGMNSNIEINRYLFDALGLQKSLQQHTKELFAKHTELFSKQHCTIDTSFQEFPMLLVKEKNKVLKVPAYSSIAYLNGKPIELGSVAVYMDKTDTFYLPSWLIELFK